VCDGENIKYEDGNTWNAKMLFVKRVIFYCVNGQSSIYQRCAEINEVHKRSHIQ